MTEVCCGGEAGAVEDEFGWLDRWPTAVGGGSCVAAADALAGTAGAVACGAAGVLAVDRRWRHDRGRGGGGGCVDTGRCPVVPSRWRGEPISLPPTATGRYLSFAEREEIALLRARDLGVREIGGRVRA